MSHQFSPGVELPTDSEPVEEDVSRFDSAQEALFSNAAYAPPTLSKEELENLEQLTNHAAETLKSRNPLIDDSIAGVIASQLGCLLAMPLLSDMSPPQTQMQSPLDRCKNGDTSLRLADVFGHAEEFSFDQQGSQFLQEKLETATDEEKDAIFEEIRPDAPNLIVHIFGNNVIQKFFDYGSVAQIRELAEVLLGNVVNLALHLYGCRVLQIAFDTVDMDKRVSMAKELDGHVIRCVRDQHGSHVVSKIIECVPHELIGFLVSTLSAEVTSLSNHPHACHVIQTLLQFCDEESERLVIVSRILQDVDILSHHQHGNYVIQHVLEYGKQDERSAIIRKLSGKIVEMSTHKIASNVVKKGLSFGEPQEQHLIVDEILNESDTLEMMIKDLNGNCVVETALEVSNSEQFANMVSRITHYLNAAQTFNYEQHNVPLIEKLIEKAEKIIKLRILQAASQRT